MKIEKIRSKTAVFLTCIGTEKIQGLNPERNFYFWQNQK